MTDLHRMFYHNGIPYGSTACKILEEGNTIVIVNGNDRFTLADVEIVEILHDEAKRIFEMQRLEGKK